jgi:hypothetical protein
MFFSSPSRDMNIIIFLVVIALGISLLAYLRSKKLFFGFIIFSILSNAIFWVTINYRLAIYYHITWLLSFSKNIWPIINLVLLIILIFNLLKNAKSKNKKV